MNSVRDILKKAFRHSFMKIELYTIWDSRFPIMKSYNHIVYKGGEEEFLERITQLVFDHYPEKKILAVLAQARLEGRWSPE